MTGEVLLKERPFAVLLKERPFAGPKASIQSSLKYNPP